MKELLTAPKMFGNTLYPGGAPLQPENHHWQDTSVRDLYFKIDDGLNDDDEFNFIKEYIIYHINAPCFSFEEKDLENLTAKAEAIKQPGELQDFVFGLLDYGIDIF